MFSKPSFEMLIDLVENRISDPELHEPANRLEFAKLQTALSELTGLRGAASAGISAVRRGRPSKRAYLHA